MLHVKLRTASYTWLSQNCPWGIRFKSPIGKYLATLSENIQRGEVPFPRVLNAFETSGLLYD